MELTELTGLEYRPISSINHCSTGQLRVYKQKCTRFHVSAFYLSSKMLNCDRFCSNTWEGFYGLLLSGPQFRLMFTLVSTQTWQTKTEIKLIYSFLYNRSGYCPSWTGLKRRTFRIYLSCPLLRDEIIYTTSGIYRPVWTRMVNNIYYWGIEMTWQYGFCPVVKSRISCDWGWVSEDSMLILRIRS